MHACRSTLEDPTYGLLLGLAVANVASGFGDMWRDRQARVIGLCAPLIALAVLLGCMNLWLVYWRLRADVAFDVWRMLTAAGVALPYIFISRAMFPSDTNRETSLDEHYLASRTVILGALATSPIVSMLSNVLLAGGYQGWSILWIALRIVTPLALIPFASMIVQRIGLVAIVLLLLVGLFR